MKAWSYRCICMNITLRNLMTILYWNAGETSVYMLEQFCWSSEYIHDIDLMKISLRCVLLEICVKCISDSVLFNLKKVFRIFLFHSKPFSFRGLDFVTTFRLNWYPFKRRKVLYKDIEKYSNFKAEIGIFLTK